jgi:hypothetical protein
MSAALTVIDTYPPGRSVDVGDQDRWLTGEIVTSEPTGTGHAVRVRVNLRDGSTVDLDAAVNPDGVGTGGDHTVRVEGPHPMYDGPLGAVMRAELGRRGWAPWGGDSVLALVPAQRDGQAVQVEILDREPAPYPVSIVLPGIGGQVIRMGPNVHPSVVLAVLAVATERGACGR